MNEIYIKFIYNLECLPGYFGVDCRESCSGHCINDESCNHISGHCSSGCQDGYFGEMCNNCKLWILHHLGYISRSMVVGFYKMNKNSNNDHNNNYINNNLLLFIHRNCNLNNTYIYLQHTSVLINYSNLLLVKDKFIEGQVNWYRLATFIHFFLWLF